MIIKENVDWHNLKSFQKIDIIEVHLKANLLSLRLGNVNSFKLDEITKEVLNMFELVKTILINKEIEREQE